MNLVFSIILKVVLAQFGLAGGGGSSSYDSGGSSSSSNDYSSSSDYGSYDSYSGGGSGGGRSSGSSSGEGSIFFFIFFVVVMALFSMLPVFIAIAFARYSRKRRLLSTSSPSIKEGITDHDTTENDKKVHVLAEQIFYSYQKDWSEFNTSNIRNYTTSSYFTHAVLMLEALKDMNRRNSVENVKVLKVSLLNRSIPDDFSGSIECQVKFLFNALDIVTDEKTKAKLFEKDYYGISETWNFIYDENGLKLSGISQPTESAEHTYDTISGFAKENQLFYSPDWGRYCLPEKGVIFSSESLYSADVNNHVIGKWGDTLVQLYTYAPTPGQAVSSYYLVGQLTVPKDYLGIIIKSKKAKFIKPSKYDKFELEWNDFNDRYEVFASKHDALPAFELLEPKFMADLYDRELDYSIEVIGSSIYIFAPVKSAKSSDYRELLNVLAEAYQRLKQ